MTGHTLPLSRNNTCSLGCIDGRGPPGSGLALAVRYLSGESHRGSAACSQVAVPDLTSQFPTLSAQDPVTPRPAAAAAAALLFIDQRPGLAWPGEL